MKRGAGYMKYGNIYEVHLPDKYANVCVQYIDILDIISNHFNYSICDNIQNQ